VGNIGWTEGWVTFNVAYNLSLAYMAWNDIEISVSGSGNTRDIRLKAPLNFNYGIAETVGVDLREADGAIRKLSLVEESANSEYFTGLTDAPRNTDDTLVVSYGYGYFKKEAVLTNTSTGIDRREIRVGIDQARLAVLTNPFNSSTTIRYAIPRSGRTVITIVDIMGKPVVVLIDREMSVGSYELNWNAKNNRNIRVASGMYFLRMSYEGRIQERRLALLR
jgi:hypothetical protein